MNLIRWKEGKNYCHSKDIITEMNTMSMVRKWNNQNGQKVEVDLIQEINHRKKCHWSNQSNYLIIKVFLNERVESQKEEWIDQLVWSLENQMFLSTKEAKEALQAKTEGIRMFTNTMNLNMTHHYLWRRKAVR